MYKSYQTGKAGPKKSYDHSREAGVKQRSFIRRSTAFNFVAILLVAVAILALHRAGRKFLHQESPDEAAATAFVDKAAPAETHDASGHPVAIHTMSEQAPAEAAEFSDEGAQAHHTEEPSDAQEETAAAPETTPAKGVVADEKPVLPERRTVRKGTLHKAPAQGRWPEDKNFSVESLDNPQARQKYRQLNTGLTKGETYSEPRPETRTSRTAPQSARSESHVELDSEDARLYYRKQNAKLSKSSAR